MVCNSDNFSTVSCRLSTNADTYDKARKLSIVAEETSNIESTDESATKHKRKAPATSDVEDGDGIFCCLF